MGEVFNILLISRLPFSSHSCKNQVMDQYLLLPENKIKSHALNSIDYDNELSSNELLIEQTTAIQ